MANEKRLIDANGSYTLNANDNTGYSICFGGGIISVFDDWGRCVCEFDAEDAPTVDAVEVVHGRWVWKPTNEYTQILTCSVCGRTEGANEHHKYCPKCGAKMDGCTWGDKKEDDDGNA